MQLYIFLKGSCSGQRRLSTQDLKDISERLGLSVKTTRRNLKKLLNRNWCGFNKKSGYYFIRSFEKVRQIENFKTKTATEFSEQYLKYFKAFAAGACIGYQVNSLKRKRITERDKRGSKHMTRGLYIPLANSLTAKLLNVSVSKAHSLRKLAKRGGFILTQKNFIPTGVKVFEVNHYKKTDPENASRIRIKKGEVVLIDSEGVRSLLRFKRRDKMRMINKRLQVA